MGCGIAVQRPVTSSCGTWYGPAEVGEVGMPAFVRTYGGRFDDSAFSFPLAFGLGPIWAGREGAHFGVGWVCP